MPPIDPVRSSHTRSRLHPAAPISSKNAKGASLSCAFLRECPLSMSGQASPASLRKTRPGRTHARGTIRSALLGQLEQTIGRLNGLGGAVAFEDYPGP